MSTIEDRPTIGERYSSAMESSNLRLGERRGDADYLIAAALIRNPLAAALYRLQSEYDGIRAEHHAAAQRVRDLEKMAKGERGEDDATGRSADERAAEILQWAESEARTAHVLILSRLTTRREAVQLFGHFCEAQATRLQAAKRITNVPPASVRIISGKLIDSFLSPRCPACQGRGTMGGGRHEHTGPSIPCRECGRTGLRRDTIALNADQAQLVSEVQLQLSSLMDEAQQEIRRGLNRVEQAKMAINEAGG